MSESQVFSDQRGRLPKKESALLANRILKKEKKRLPVNIIFSNDNYLHELNSRFRNKNRPTDVLAFPADPDEEILGEIYISVETARRQARDYRVTLKKEILRLVAHGTLHLCGYDHQDSGEATRMRNMEDKHISGFLNNG